MDSVVVAKDELLFQITQAEGGLIATDGASAGLTVTDATGKAECAQAAHLKPVAW